IASFRVSETVSVPVMPTRSSEGMGGTGRGCTAGKLGSCVSPVTGGVVVSAGGTVPGVAAGAAVPGAVVAGGCVDGCVCTPGGVCGAGCCVPGGVCGFAGGLGRAVGGTVCCCSVPGGLVASVCAGVVAGGCVAGVCVEDWRVSAAVETTKGSPIFLKSGLRAFVFALGCGERPPFASAGEASAGDAAGFALALSDDLSETRAAAAFARESSEAAAFPKADTAFPKTRNAERQAAHSALEALRAGSKGRVSLCIFST